MPSSATELKVDILAAWKEVQRRLAKMTDEEKRQTLIQAGILTPKGNLRAAYKPKPASESRSPASK